MRKNHTDQGVKKVEQTGEEVWNQQQDQVPGQDLKEAKRNLEWNKTHDDDVFHSQDQV